ncbi:MAG TPA: choice-of-anchor D domain-containing protein [Terriglobales bacterium]|nr:choice-of-anchor D domain-containing protein [Terriglobales bacterium]
MRSNYLKTLKTAVLAITVLLLGVSASFAQSVNLAAGTSSVTLPDGSTVQMWGYTCTAAAPATCAALNPNAGTSWSPVVITVPPGSLTVNLTNNLPASVPETSLVIVGQLGAGLGKTATSTPSPTHTTQGVTWPAADAATTNTPPPQGNRVQSFSTPVGPGASRPLTWSNLKEGTYLIESGTHPSIQGAMGLYGILVVTTAPVAGTSRGKAYSTPLVNYDAEIPLLFSEIDPVQNNSVSAAVNTANFSETKVWSGQPGGCGNPASGAEYLTCYPPAVNYSPRYYLINGVAFDKTKVSASLFNPSPAATSGSLLVRMVNAGLRMNVPSIVGSLTGTSAVPGFGLIAEDGNPLPGVTRVQNEVFLAAGKTYDVVINVPVGTAALPIFDRSLGLSANATARDAGMLAYIGPSGATLPVPSVTASATGETYYCVAGTTLTMSDPSRSVLANDTGANGVVLQGNPANHSVTPFGSGAATDSLTLNPDGTFTYTQAPANTSCGGTFTYLVNGTASATATIAQCDATSSVAACQLGGAPTTNPDAYTSRVSPSTTAPSARLQIAPPGVLVNDTDPQGHPLTAVFGGSCSGPGAALPAGAVSLDKNGSFSATVSAPGTYHFCYHAVNSQKTVSAAAAAVTLNFPAPSNLHVSLVDGVTKVALTPQDYRWIIEEDRTFFVDPNCQTNPLPVSCPTATPQGAPAIFGTNFHTAYMPVVAQGCVGTISCENGQSLLGAPAVCDIGNGACRPGATKTPVDPSQVVLDPTKHYYVSVLPGDAMDPGHAMGGSQIAPGQTNVTVLVEPQEQPPAKVSAFVFEDDHPLNGEHDASGGIDSLAPNEPGLGGFNLTIIDLVGMSGDSAGQLTYDEFGQPLSNALAGTIDPVTGKDACPVTANPTTGFDGGESPTGITGVIPVCPKYESDGTTLSPLAGQAIVANMPPGRYGIIATPGADRIARGEEWLQTNTLDGGKDHEAFLKVNEPAYFQEFGPAGYHVSIGFANPAFIRAAGQALCTGPGAPACTQTVTGVVTGARMSRPSDERLYGSGSRDTFGYTQCYASLGSPDGADIAFAKCDDAGNFVLTGIPAGDWRLTIFDQWNDQIVDGISTPVRVGGATNATLCHGPGSSGSTCDMGEIGVHGWKNNLSTRTFFDINGDGVSQDNETGLSLVPTNIRYRDGSISNLNSTDLQGFAGFNEVFPIFNWYVVETDSTRYKNTGTHVINDAGGPVDGSTGSYACGQGGYPACGSSALMQNMARTFEDFPLPTNLRIPGAVYCDNADCTGFSIAARPAGGGPGGSTGRIDPPWATSYGWQSFMGQNQFLEFGKKPFAAGENGGIRGHVVYASTRPFDDPALLLQLTWEPQVPQVTINLYQEGFAPDGVTPTLTKVDTTTTSSWDDWAQGFRSDGVPNMNCPGQSTGDPFFYTMLNQPSYLDWYNSEHGGAPVTPLPNNSQYKCYDGMHMWNQLQPAPYDGMYQFPSVTGINPTTGRPAGTNCTICTPNTAAPVGDYSRGLPMLPAGKYVVEMVVPPGYELVKEEDKNILLGDTYIAPVTQQFAGFGNVFIMPDQASVSANYNPNNPLIPSSNEGVTPRHEGDTGSVETFWPCVGTARIVPDYMSLFPLSGQNAPFAGATRHLCDRKEVTLEDQMSVLAKFYVFSSTHVAAHFTGIISDDFTSEFDPFSPAFGEKFSPPNLPVGIKDWAGNEIARIYSDQHGIYNGLNYSSFSVNPPDPSGYIPQMMTMCMNDRGQGVTPDPFYQAAYSQFCYEWSFMPGQTSYLDTPAIPTAAFAAGYNHPDCAYPDATPAISEVDGDGVGPWISASGTTHPITIHALGNQVVNNYGYSGPQATTAPYNAKTVTRHYGFGATQGTGSVTIGGVTATVSSWTDTQIVVTLPSTGTQVPLCSLQQRGTSGARCGELVITAGNGKQSVDTVTVTISVKAPTRLLAGQTIQSAIDAAVPGDLIIVPPGTYSELLLMWKPVRLQGVGAASSIINADAHPAGKLDPWRQRVVCLFGLGLNGVSASWDPGCGAGLGMTSGFTATRTNPQVDRLPLEATVGWDASLNGNLAEQLQEPTLMGAYEGAGITVLSKGVRYPNGSDPFDAALAGGFPDGTILLTGNNANNTNCNAFPSDFYCNPSRIDGLSVMNSSQGGGGIYVHGWAHNLEISNNRINNNQGTLAGGITVGQGEHPPGYLGGAGAVNSAPGSCQTSNVANLQLPYCFDRFVNIHHNAVTTNSSEGDELFAATPSGSGGVAFCSGADNYHFNYNWVCGNMSTGDGGGVSHLGFIWDGSIQHNSILFNQSTNPTTPSNGGGLLIMSAPDTDPLCPGEPDADCSHAYGSVGDGIGRNLVINANLIMGNAADAGSGGGISFQGVNGIEVSTFPNTPSRWYSVNVTNNIITNNVAGWDGGGVSLQDSIGVNLINNTIVSNDATASSGTLFGAFFASRASAPTPCPRDAQGASIPCVPLSDPQPAGLSSAGHSAEFLASLPASITCPPGHPINTANPNNGVVNGACRTVSFPILYNDVFWQNRAFNIVVTQPVAGSGSQQATVELVPALNQASTGACVAPPNALSYWDIGLRGDHGPNDHSSGVSFTPRASILTDAGDYPGGNSGFRVNSGSNPNVVRQYCNGSKIPPEAGTGVWYLVPPGTNEGNVPVPIFNLTAGATVDEGNNWISMTWGPLSRINPTTETNPSTETVLGDYSLASGSPAIGYITPATSSTTYAAAPANDFFENPRKTNNAVDVGAVEFAAPAVAVLNVTGGPLVFGNVPTGTSSASRTLTLQNSGGAGATGITLVFSSPLYSRPAGAAGGTCGTSLGSGANCTINVVFSPTALGLVNATLTINASVAVTGSPVNLSGTGVAPVIAATLTPATRNFGTVTRNCPGTTLAQIAACALDPAQVFTLTNTGNVTLTGIAQGALGGLNATEFSVARVLSTCGPTGNGQIVGNITLAPGTTCAVTVQFKPLTAQTTGLKNATISVTDSAGTQTSTLTGTAN